ncbi:hypothetical protein LTR28_013603 [Elasticomyces elasticus]|nr:hypothetical protein LTR28_013603 [Elasticomyces elasticus]
MAFANADLYTVVANQIQEMEVVRGKIYQLEQTHMAMKQKYEEDIARLRHELEVRGGPPAASHNNANQPGPQQHNVQPPPPAIGHGPANLFQGIMAGAAQGGGPGLAPPPQDPQGQPIVRQGVPEGMPGHMGPQAMALTPAAPGPPQHPFGGGYGMGPQPGVGVNGERRDFSFSTRPQHRDCWKLRTSDAYF